MFRPAFARLLRIGKSTRVAAVGGARAVWRFVYLFDRACAALATGVRRSGIVAIIAIVVGVLTFASALLASVQVLAELSAQRDERQIRADQRARDARNVLTSRTSGPRERTEALETLATGRGLRDPVDISCRTIGDWDDVASKCRQPIVFEGLRFDNSRFRRDESGWFADLEDLAQDIVGVNDDWGGSGRSERLSDGARGLANQFFSENDWDLGGYDDVVPPGSKADDIVLNVPYIEDAILPLSSANRIRLSSGYFRESLLGYPDQPMTARDASFDLTDLSFTTLAGEFNRLSVTSSNVSGTRVLLLDPVGVEPLSMTWRDNWAWADNPPIVLPPVRQEEGLAVITLKVLLATTLCDPAYRERSIEDWRYDEPSRYGPDFVASWRIRSEQYGPAPRLSEQGSGLAEGSICPALTLEEARARMPDVYPALPNLDALREEIAISRAEAAGAETDGDAQRDETGR